MRILMVGAGAVGGFVGGRLVQAGRDVTFLVRPGRAAQIQERGLRITDGTQSEAIDVRAVTKSTLDGPSDLILVGVKAQALGSAIEDFAPAVGPGTAVVPLQFIWRSPALDADDELNRRYGAADKRSLAVLNRARELGVIGAGVPDWWLLQSFYALSYTAFEMVHSGHLAPLDAPGLALNTLLHGIGAEA
jgi:hypothetical protein